MKKDKQLKIPDIIIKQMNKEISVEEEIALQEWLAQSEDNKGIYKRICNSENIKSMIKSYDDIDNDLAWQKINRRTEPKGKLIRKIMLTALKYAAVFLIPMMIAAYLVFLNKAKEDLDISFEQLEEQITNMEESSLVMSDGSIVSLSKESSDSIHETDGTRITKEEKEILYSNVVAENTVEVKFNTLITPKSKVFNVVLADGTKVWLNASSAIKYPTQFLTEERKVYLIGEAYFDVAKDKSKPFIVSTKEMDVEVLGTSFNVMAYPDEDLVEATLVEGEIKVKTAKHRMAIKPGKQVQFNKKSELFKELKVNTDLYVSWKDGKYIFEYKNLETVMTKLSRWYGVEIDYLNKDMRNIHFTGTLYKYNDIKQTLHVIELSTNVKFELVENAVKVSSK